MAKQICEWNAWVADQLEDWADTFTAEENEDGEGADNNSEILALVAKIRADGRLTTKDYSEIIFQLWSKLQ